MWAPPILQRPYIADAQKVRDLISGIDVLPGIRITLEPRNGPKTIEPRPAVIADASACLLEALGGTVKQAKLLGTATHRTINGITVLRHGLRQQRSTELRDDPRPAARSRPLDLVERGQVITSFPVHRDWVGGSTTDEMVERWERRALQCTTMERRFPWGGAGAEPVSAVLWTAFESGGLVLELLVGSREAGAAKGAVDVVPVDGFLCHRDRPVWRVHLHANPFA